MRRSVAIILRDVKCGLLIEAQVVVCFVCIILRRLVNHAANRIRVA